MTTLLLLGTLLLQVVKDTAVLDQPNQMTDNSRTHRVLMLMVVACQIRLVALHLHLVNHSMALTEAAKILLSQQDLVHLSRAIDLAQPPK